jgi:phosphoribosylanthranilate isomerase
MVNALRPDLAGFICAPGFWRHIDRTKASQLRKHLDPQIPAVGVFVNQPVSEILEYLRAGTIQMVQLHGQEDEAYIGTLRAAAASEGLTVFVIQAFQVHSPEDLKRAGESSADLILLDGGSGSGQTFDWTLVDQICRPWLRAGGLDADNLSQALQQLHPGGVDISSGVETDRKKDPGKIAACIAIVRKYEEAGGKG